MCKLRDCTILSEACLPVLPKILFNTEHTATPHCGKRSPNVLLCNAIPAFPVTSCVCDLVCDSACDTQRTLTPTNLLVQPELCSRTLCSDLVSSSNGTGAKEAEFGKGKFLAAQVGQGTRRDENKCNLGEWGVHVSLSRQLRS